MATLAELSPTPPHSPSYSMRRKSWARRCERYCCNVVSYLPLGFVYGLGTWSVWVATKIGMQEPKSSSRSYAAALLAIALYGMLNWCYSTAVFTDPGSPVDAANGGYNSLPTQELSRPYTSFTVKSNGELRYCKKCQTKKPDRSHHCSTCKRCVLKMDHHCPWLAACIGLHNYKPFLLFLVYVSLFCWTCFGLSGGWCWDEFTNEEYMDSLMPVNYIVLAVISGIVGLVITGFTAWHIMLAARGLTTIESLEKTRYLSPLRRSMQQHFNDQGQRHYVDTAEGRPSIGEQIIEAHANALPGVTRPEEGEERRSDSPAEHALQRNWTDMEVQRERDRYNDYLDELDSEKLPNAFDLGWRRNLMHVLGEKPWLWALPICNTTGDGWRWEASPDWIAARERIAEERHTQMQRQKDRERAAGWGIDSPPSTSPPRYNSYTFTGNGSPIVTTRRSDEQAAWGSIPSRGAGPDSRFLMTSNGVTTVPREGRRSPGKADQILGRAPGLYSDDPGMPVMPGVGVPMQFMPRPKRVIYDDMLEDHDEDDDDDEYEDSSDEGEGAALKRKTSAVTGASGSTGPAIATGAGAPAIPQITTENWNDLPAEMMGGAGAGSGSGTGPRAKRGPTAARRMRAAGEEWQEWTSK